MWGKSKHTGSQRIFLPALALLLACEAPEPGSEDGDGVITEVAATIPLSIVRLTLIDADTDQPIAGFALVDGARLDLRTIGAQHFNVVAITSSDTRSVRFRWTRPDATTTQVIESLAPFALGADDTRGDYYPLDLALGQHTLQVTGFSGTGASGTAGSSMTVHFTVLRSSSDWPAAANPALPFAGIFYGNPYHGDHTGNGYQFRHEASRRFRAERTGRVSAIRYANRTLKMANIIERCTEPRASNVWCQCLDGGLDQYTCGYHLGNSYSVGNGGALYFQIREDDGSPEHLPSGTVLGESTTAFVPMDHASEDYPIIQLSRPADLVEGRVYHLVLQQRNPATLCPTNGRTVAEARSCDRTRGQVGMNGAYTGEPTDPSGGPFGGETSALLSRDSSTAAWSLRKDVKPWYEVRYDDGVWVGDSAGAYGAGHDARVVGGQVRVRERFTVRDATRQVDGVWLRVGRTSAASSGDLTLELRQVGLSTPLATARLAAASVAEVPASAPFSAQVNWVYVPLSSTATLTPGTSYTITLRAGIGAGYVTSTTFAMTGGAFDSLSRNQWPDARAELSSDGGGTWGNYAASYPERDLQLAFTIAGMPRRLP